MKLNKHVEELLSRKPNKWLNITKKEFERDITLLQETILELQDIVEDKENENKYYIQKWVGVFVGNLEMMDEYIPQWREHCKSEIKQLRTLLK